MMTESEALLAEMEASLADTPPEMRSILEQQIKNLRDANAMYRKAMPAMEENKRHRPQLSPEVRAFFTPEPGPQVPTWVPDSLVRAQAGAQVVRCPQGAQVYEDELTVGCAVPRGIGNIPMRHGLTLTFYHNGLLRSQRFYDGGLLRWDIEYHASGGRETFGLYADRVEREHLQHGLQTRMTTAGVVVGQSYYHAGVMHGWSKLWEEDGFPISACLYQEGNPVEDVYPDGTRRRR